MFMGTSDSIIYKLNYSIKAAGMKSRKCISDKVFRIY